MGGPPKIISNIQVVIRIPRVSRIQAQTIQSHPSHKGSLETTEVEEKLDISRKKISNQESHTHSGPSDVGL